MAGLIPIPLTPEQLQLYVTLGTMLVKGGIKTYQEIKQLFGSSGLDKETVDKLTGKWDEAVAKERHRAGLPPE